MGKIKIIFVVLLVVAVAGAAGSFAAVQYSNLKAVFQARQDEKDAAYRAKIKAQEEKEAAAREKARQKQEREDRRNGTAEEPDQVIRGLTADMRLSRTGEGAVYYEYEDPQEDGIFIQPYILKNPDGLATIHIILRHRGEGSVGFTGLDLYATETEVYHLNAAAPVAQTKIGADGEGLMEWCDQVADANALKALRAISAGYSGKLVLQGFPNGSNDDRVLTATEVQRIQNILKLCDLLNKQAAQ